MQLWKRILQKNRGSMPRGASPKHLLWALHFLKDYGMEAVLTTFLMADEKTIRKWVWYMVEAIASMDDDVVSTKIRCRCHY
jgi:hypothetical protein